MPAAKRRCARKDAVLCIVPPAVRVLQRSHSWSYLQKFHWSYLQVLYMTGWAPHASQQQPSRRGSATVSFEDLQDALKEQSDKAGNAK